MYESRLYFTNGIISFELDALNGEPLAFVREDCENARKNHFLKVTDVIDGIVYCNGEARHLNIPRYAQIRLDEELKPTIQIRQEEKEAEAVIFYPNLVANEEKIAVSATVTITLPQGECTAHWNLKLENRTEHEITEVSFPELGGLWLGDSWEENTLVIPRVAGALLPNPTKTVATPPPTITWKWQEYLHRYVMGNRHGVADDRGLHIHRCPYTGGGSMLWMDLFSEEEDLGIYITCFNPEFQLKDVHVTSFGESYPGIGLGILHHCCMEGAGVWESEECMVSFHRGDWHWAADEYRAMRDRIHRPVLENGPALPDWFRVSTGLAAHYDFRYQGGGIVHRFADIPELYRSAQKQGLDHLFIAGWHVGGFDYGFPCYEPDPELGGSEGLKKALAEVHEMGGHVTFYLNSRLCNVDFENQKERIEKSAVMRHDRGLRIENYGAGDVRFASLCMNEPDWREYFASSIGYLFQEMGADGVYLDQLAMTLGMTCYHPGHKEHEGNPAAWNHGYEKLLDVLRRENPGKAIFYEGCCDIFGRGVSAQLISTLRQARDGVTPEIYRYTFPDEVLLDMENPRRHSGMRPEFVARKSTFFLYRGFVCGLYFWVYDLEQDNTFSRDPEQLARLLRATGLKKIWLEKFGLGTFRDQIGLVGVTKKDLAKRYTLKDGSSLVALARENGLQKEIGIQWEKADPAVTLYTENHPQGIKPEFRLENGVLTVALPSEELALVHVQ